jgi:predicted adenine nucleotide alpha hydrolase (AANH) superfamily ATPase
MADGWDVFGYFFNPNIHPYTEFIKRLECVETHNKRVGIEYYIDGDDALRPFLKATLQAEDAGVPRCGGCYRLRLAKAAKFAKENGFSFFTTTLLYSRHQDHSLIVSIARECAEENGIEFYYEDFRKGWQVGIARSKELNMYRQSYCGCVFSEAERYRPKAVETARV